MTLKEILQGLKMEARTVTVTEDQIPEVEEWLGMKLGPQLREFVLEYSYIMGDGIEIMSINADIGPKSRMVKSTNSLRKSYRGTENYAVIEEEALYYVDVVVDTEDNVFYIDGNDCSLINPGLKLFDYVYFRLKYGDWLFMNDEGRAKVEMSEEDRLYFAEHSNPV